MLKSITTSTTKNKLVVPTQTLYTESMKNKATLKSDGWYIIYVNGQEQELHLAANTNLSIIDEDKSDEGEVEVYICESDEFIGSITLEPDQLVLA